MFTSTIFDLNFDNYVKLIEGRCNWQIWFEADIQQSLQDQICRMINCVVKESQNIVCVLVRIIDLFYQNILFRSSPLHHDELFHKALFYYSRIFTNLCKII